MEALNDGKENRQISLNNNGRSKSPCAIESLLLLDNTLLCNIEPDNGLYVSVDTRQSFQEHNETAQVSKESLQSVATNATASSKISFSVSPNVNEQDKTLMNQIFAQFDSQNEEEINSESCNNISNYDIFDTFYKEDTRFDLNNVNQNVEKTDQLHKNVLHQDKLMDASYLHITNFDDDTLKDNDFKKDDKDSSPILKTKSRPLNECKSLKKKLRFSNDVLIPKEAKNETNSTNYSSFYGLPDTVKKLIQEVKGICELYRKFTIIYKSNL